MPVRKVGIYIDPKGSEIYLDNELRGFSPLILYLPLGVYKVKAKAVGAPSEEERPQGGNYHVSEDM